MNILVRTYSGKVVFRPDTTWERRNKDFYVPDSVSSLEFAPVVFVRISRAGRSIAEKFATRYFDAVGRGVLLYAKFGAKNSGKVAEDEESYAAGICLNQTSYLPDSSLKATAEANRDDMEYACRAISDCSFSCQLREGDLAAIETAPRKEITDETFDFEIIR